MEGATVTDAPPLDPLTRRAGRFAATVLGVDAAFHLYWLTGATWPASDERALSMAVLGYPVPFTARILVPLATLLAIAATALWWRLARGPRGIAGRAAHLVTLAVAAATAGQLPLRTDWALGFGSRSAGPVFYWLNLLVYLPVCTLLALAAYRVARHGMSRGRRLHRLVLALPVVFAAAIAFAAYTYVPGSEDYPAVTDQRSRFLDTRVARFHYLREGSGPPLVLLPGGTASTYAWQPQLEALSATHTVYVVDLPGQGYTEPRDSDAYDLPAMEAAIGAFLDAAGLSRVDLAGHSWSGGWALSYAQSHPERVNRLILLASSGLDVRDVVSWEILKTPVVGELIVNFGYTRDALRAGIPDLFVHKERATPDLAEAMWRPLTARQNLRSVYELERSLDWRRTQSRMPTTTQPTLIIWGAEDTTLPSWQAARFAELMPHAQAHVVDGCGHAITLDCPDEVNSLMRNYLS